MAATMLCRGGGGQQVGRQEVPARAAASELLYLTSRPTYHTEAAPHFACIANYN